MVGFETSMIYEIDLLLLHSKGSQNFLFALSKLEDGRIQSLLIVERKL